MRKPSKAKRAELLEILKETVRLREMEWDSERDFELQLGKDIDGFSTIVDDLAIAGADSVTEENLLEILAEVSA